MRSNRFMAVAMVCLVWAASSAALPQHETAAEDSINGDWKITFTLPGGQSASGTIAFRVEGNRLTGTVETAHTGPGTLQDGKWDHGKFTTTCVFEKHESIALAGEFKDGKLAGTFHTEGMDGTWEAARAAKNGGASKGE